MTHPDDARPETTQLDQALNFYLSGMASGVLTTLTTLHPEIPEDDKVAMMQEAMHQFTGDPIAVEQLRQVIRDQLDGITHPDNIVTIEPHTSQALDGE